MENEHNRNRLFVSLLSSYILFLFSIQIFTIGLSLWHIHFSPSLARLILGASIAIALVTLFRKKSLPAYSQSGKKPNRWQIPFLSFLAISVGLYLILWAAAYRLPDLSWDGNAYHIPSLAMWDIKGYVSWINTTYLEQLINGYPKGAELISYIVGKGLGNSFINTTNLLFLPIGILGIALIADTLGVGNTLALCIGSTFLFLPVNITQSVTTYVDTAYACSVIGLITMMVYLALDPAAKWKYILVTGAAMGLVLSIKSTGVMVSGLVLVAVMIIWMFDRLYSPRAIPEHQIRKPRAKIIFQLVLVICMIFFVAVACGGYWYIRNYVMTGTPLYPVGMTFLGHTLFPGLSISDAISETNNTPILYQGWPPLFRIVYAWAQGFVNWPKSIYIYDSRTGGLGFLWLLGCVPAIIIAIFSSIRSRSPQIKTLFFCWGLWGSLLQLLP